MTTSSNSSSERTSQHTSLPWRVLPIPGDRSFIAAEPYEGHPYFGVTRTIEIMSGEDYPTREADAEFIVRACNSHDELVDALRGIQEIAGVVANALPTCQCYGPSITPRDQLCTRHKVQSKFAGIDSAIAKAEGRQ